MFSCLQMYQDHTGKFVFLLPIPKLICTEHFILVMLGMYHHIPMLLSTVEDNINFYYLFLLK